MRILQQAFRVYAAPEAFGSTIAFYEQAQSLKCERRIRIAETGVDVAKVGGFLILSAPAEILDRARHVTAIFYVDQLDDFMPWLRGQGATIIAGPHLVTGGKNLTARHPDGLTVEYFEAIQPGK